MPTLIEKGTIKPPHGSTPGEKARIADTVAIEYVVERLVRRTAPRGDLASSIKSWVDHVVLLVAGTGSGKSVSVPPALYMAIRDTAGRNVINTMPSTVSAVRTVQDDVSQYFPLTIGKDLGYQTSALTKKPVKGLIYATVGTLLQQMKIMEPEEIMRKYSCIIIDEAHQRSLETDMTMAFLKKLLVDYWNDPDCPLVVLMSATLEVDRFSKFFGERNIRPEIIEVVGRTYPVIEHFLPVSAGNYIWKAIDIIRDLHSRTDDYNNTDSDGASVNRVRDILVFVNGEAQIRKILDALGPINKELPADNKFFAVKFTGTVFKTGGKELREVEAPIDTLRIDGIVPKRKIIVATNVAETSLTITTLKYVVDTGFRNNVSFVPSNYTVFIQSPITQDMAKQRKGRVGRVTPGEWYPVYTEETYKAMQLAQYPDILTNDITPSILSLIVKDGTYCEEALSLMDKPPEDMLWLAMEKLYALGAITVEPVDGKPAIVCTETGRFMNKFRKLSMENIKMILSGYHWGANILDLITIAVMLDSQVSGRKYTPREINIGGKVDINRQEFLIGDTFIDLLFLFEEFRIKVQSRNMKLITDWCTANDVNYVNMINIIRARDELIDDLVSIVGFDPLYNGLNIDPTEYSLRDMMRKAPDIAVDEIIKIKKCILAGYCMNVAILRDQDGMPSHYESIHCGYKIQTPAGLKSSPRYFVFDKAMLRAIRGEYQIMTGSYSILDGFVEYDHTKL